ncbi:MAG: n-acetylglutamate synthase [Bacteroidota bacterium]
MDINLNKKIFKAEMNTENGEVSDETRFSYFQKGRMIWADYEGGEIVKGHLIGHIKGNSLEFVYHHLNKVGEIMTGKCTSFPEITSDHKIRLKEKWQWTSGDMSEGESTLIEV